MNFTLTKTQQDALIFCKDKNKAILAMEPGCGKTITALSIAKKKGYRKIYLISPPKVNSFEDDNEKHFDNYFEIKKVSHGAFRLDDKKPVKFKKGQIREWNASIYDKSEKIDDDNFIIVDEAHKFKNIESTRTKCLYALLHRNRHLPLLFLTGTLRPNMNCDASTVANMANYWFDKEPPTQENSLESFLSSVIKIVSISNYFSPSIPDGKYFKRENRNTEYLYEQLKNVAFFARKTNKAKKNIRAEYFHYTSMQVALLDNMQGRSSLLIGSYVTKVSHQTRARVRDGHLLLNHIVDKENKKEMEFLTNKIKYVKTINEKTIIFTQFTKTAENVAATLNSHCHTGKLNNTQSKDIVNKFKCANSGILVATIDSLSTGFDIETCDNIIFFSFSYNYANFIQSFDRIHRITSTNDKNYLFLVYYAEKNKLNTAMSKMDLHFEWLNG